MDSPHKILVSKQLELCFSQGYYVAILECYLHKVLLKNDIITNTLKLFILGRVTSQTQEHKDSMLSFKGFSSFWVIHVKMPSK